MGFIPYSSGYSPKEWQILVDTMIKKKGKKNLVLDLCTINLIDADFNFNNKVLACNTMRCTEENNQFLRE